MQYPSFDQVLEAMGQTALYADVGTFLKQYHSSDLQREREAILR